MSILQQTQMDFRKYNIELKFSLKKNLSLEIKKLLNTIMCHRLSELFKFKPTQNRFVQTYLDYVKKRRS